MSASVNEPASARLRIEACESSKRAAQDALRARGLEPPMELTARDEDVVIASAAWLRSDVRLLEFDHALHEAQDRGGPCTFAVVGEGDALLRTVVGVALRYQRLWPRRNVQAGDVDFDLVLRAHRALHALEKPLVRADYEHALDVWQWTVALSPEASRAVQVAALFHDIERLASEADVRIEQNAPDYSTFKVDHARRGADMTRAVLASIAEPALVERVCALVARHERPDADPELALLNDADALSFFALNSAGFFAYYGPEHTAMKVDYTWKRITSERARRALEDVRLERFIGEALDRVRAQPRP